MPKNKPLIAIEATTAAIHANLDAETGQPKGPATFDVLAYTGGPIEVAAYDLPVVIDLAGMESKRNLVANLDHDSRQRVGHVTQRTDEAGQLRLTGVASAATAARDEVVQSAASGFQWEASIEVLPLQLDELAKGKKVEVNGRTVEGPAYVARASRLKGFAFVSHGADSMTSVAIAATATISRGDQMKVSKEVQAFIKSIGLDANDLSDQQLADIEANYNGQNGRGPQPSKKSGNNSLDDVFAEERENQARERRIAEITAEAINNNRHAGEDFIKGLERKARAAVVEGWDPEKFELELLRTLRPQAHTVYSGTDQAPKQEVLEAALCKSGALTNYEKHFREDVLEAADKRYPTGISLRELFLEVARHNGYRSSSIEVNRECLKAAFAEVKASGFSTLEIPGILSNTANKFLMEGWMAVDSTWRRICAIKPVRNFLQQTSYSLTGGFQYKEVGPGGELEHATVGETTYTNQASTYGRMFSITRTDLINDDLGALTAVPRRLGRGAALKLNNVFWTAFLNNSTFFTSGNANVSTGGGSALSLSAIEIAEKVLTNQTDPDGEPLGMTAKILLVPPTLKATARSIVNSQLVIDGTATAAQGNANVWQGAFQVESSPYMENSSYTGYSNAAWYLLCDPADIAAIEVCFLNGREAPIVETADADFSTLGVSMRGYHDFGVALQEYRAGVRSAGS